MDQSPFFSIITCTYNSAKSLESCVRSVQEQKFTNYEHIFVDGFSTDSTAEIIQKYSASAPDKVRFHQAPPAGVTGAMNEGIELARGQVILHLHGDDRLSDENVLQEVFEQFQEQECSVLVGNCRLTGHPSISYTWPESRWKRWFTMKCIPVLMFYTNPIAHPSTYVAKSVFERNGVFDEQYHVVMDYDFWFRILNKESVHTLDRILSVYHFHEDTISTRQMKLGLEEIDLIRRKYRSSYPLAYLVNVVMLRPLLWLKRVARFGASAGGKKVEVQS